MRSGSFQFARQCLKLVLAFGFFSLAIWSGERHIIEGLRRRPGFAHEVFSLRHIGEEARAKKRVEGRAARFRVLPAEQESQPKTNPSIKRLARLSHVSIAPAVLLLQRSRLRPLIIQAYCVGNAAKGPKFNGFN